MHYKNGREAKNGDKVMFVNAYGGPVVGVLYDAVAGNDSCNGKLAVTSPSDPCPNLAECLHVDDVKGALGDDLSKVADLSKKALAFAVSVGLAALLWPAHAFAQAAPSAQSLASQLNLNHLLAVLGLGLLGWAYKDLNPHLKTWLAGEQADPKATPLVHTFASIGLVLDDLAESAAGHVLNDPKIQTDADVHSAATDMMKDAVDGLSDSASSVAEQYLGASGKDLVGYLVGLVKKKVADAEAAGAAASAQVASVPAAAAAIDTAAKKA